MDGWMEGNRGRCSDMMDIFLEKDNELSNLYIRIAKMFSTYPDVIYGFADISFSDYRLKYKTALVFAVPHSKILTLETYKEQLFDDLVTEARNKGELIQDKLKDIIKDSNCKYEVPPISQTDENTLIAPISFKYAAVNAGLGWIGKNGVLVTEKHGPRVRLFVLLINSDVPVSLPVTESNCPEECFKCVNACPHKALEGKQWNIGMKRREIIDYQLCNQKRSLYINTHGKKHSCGFCVVACKHGL